MAHSPSFPGANGGPAPPGKSAWYARAMKWGKRALVLAASAIATYLGWCVILLGVYAVVFPPVTGVQLQRRMEAITQPAAPQQSYEPIPLSRIDPDLPLAVVAGEDSRFFLHSGIDWTEVGNALRAYWQGDHLRGASSFTQQLVKNLFLTTHSTLLRKALEVPLTYAAELLLSKRRILELYVNVIEWGPGVFGIKAATQYHYGLPPQPLTKAQAAALAACIPAPLDRRPQTVGRYQRVIRDRMSVLDPLPISRAPLENPPIAPERAQSFALETGRPPEALTAPLSFPPAPH